MVSVYPMKAHFNVRLLRLGIITTLLNSFALACVMLPGPPTKLQGLEILGRFTYEAKPLKGSKVQLRHQGRLIATAVTDRNGYYAVRAPNKGIYEIRMLNPSYETFQVDVSPSKAKQQKFLVNFYADYCYKINVSTK